MHVLAVIFRSPGLEGGRGGRKALLGSGRGGLRLSTLLLEVAGYGGGS